MYNVHMAIVYKYHVHIHTNKLNLYTLWIEHNVMFRLLHECCIVVCDFSLSRYRLAFTITMISEKILQCIYVYKYYHMIELISF